jgi:hypothetical protein
MKKKNSVFFFFLGGKHMTKKELTGKRKLPVPGHADWIRARGDFPRNHQKKGHCYLGLL